MPLETTAALRVDLLDPGAPQIIHAVQDDSDSRKIAFSIYAGGAQWAVPDGTLVTVRYKKPDGTAGFYDTLPDGSTPAATIDGNTVTVSLVPQAFTVRGNVPVQIKLYSSAGASIATFAIVMHVSANVVSDAEIVSSDYYSVLTKQIADVLAAAEGIPGQVSAAQAAAEQAASSASAAAGSATAAADSADTASTAAEQAQTAATDAGTSETNAAKSASDAEDAKTAAETAAGSASDDATAAENAKTAAETAATNAEAAAKALEDFGDPVTIEHGGTNARDVLGARENLNVPGQFGVFPGTGAPFDYGLLSSRGSLGNTIDSVPSGDNYYYGADERAVLWAGSQINGAKVPTWKRAMMMDSEQRVQTLWSGSLYNGNGATITDGGRYAALFIGAVINGTNFSVYAVPAESVTVHFSEGGYYMDVELELNTPDLNLFVRGANNSGGRITYVWGILKYLA